MEIFESLRPKGRLQTLSPNRILSLVAQLTIISIGMITIRSIIIITTMIMVMIMIIIIIILMITTIRKEKRLWQAVATMRKLGLKSAPSIGRLLWVLNGFLARGTLPFYERILFCVMVSTSPKTFPRLCVLLVPRSHPLVVGIPCATNPTFRPAGVLSCGVRGRNLVAQNGSPDFQLVVEHRCLRYSCLRHLRMNPKGYQTTSTRINLHCKHHFYPVHILHLGWFISPFFGRLIPRMSAKPTSFALHVGWSTKTEPPTSDLYMQTHEQMYR